MRRGEWLTGKELMGRWKMQDFELLECVKYRLKPYSPTYKRPFEIPPFDPVFDRIIHDLLKPKPEQFNPNLDLKVNHIGNLLPHLSVCLFRRKDVEEFEKKSRLESANKDKEKLRPSQEAKIKCREVAKKLWKKYPSMTIADMVNEQKMLDVSKRPNGDLYENKTVRTWIRDLCPNRSPGRRPIK